MESDALIAAAREALPIVEAEADAAEQAGRMTAPVLDAFHARGLFRLWVPRALEGHETDLVTALRVFELVSSADGAAGWAVMIGAGAGLFAGFFEPAVAREIFLDPRAVIAGSGAATGVARAERGGYRVSGRWAYASGAHHATWFTANCTLEDARHSKPRNGQARVRAIAVPAGEVSIHETWSVVGMRGTGSDDISIENRFVPRARTFSVFDDEPTAAGLIYRVPFYSIAELSFAAVSLGIARHALEAFKALAREKRPLGSDAPLAADADVRARVARAEAAVRAARALTFEEAAQAWECLSRGEPVSARRQTLARVAALNAVHGCAGAVDLLYARAGMTPLFSSSALGRAWRDIHAVSQNMVVSAGLYVDAGRDLLETP